MEFDEFSFFQNRSLCNRLPTPQGVRGLAEKLEMRLDTVEVEKLRLVIHAIERWDSLGDDEKDLICDQLHQVIRSLRDLEQDPKVLSIGTWLFLSAIVSFWEAG